MRERLPIVIEKMELPEDQFKKEEVVRNSYGFVNVLYIISLLITLGSIITVFVLGNRR